MPPRDMLLMRIDRALEDLAHARGLLAAIAVAMPRDRRVRDDLLAHLDTLRKQLEQDRKEANSEKFDLGQTWAAAEKHHTEGEPLLEECRAMIEGRLARGARIDDGICRIADTLLDELSERARIAWGSFTILGNGELYSNLARVIRLRFPTTNLWNLPIAAHEFGHFVALRPELREFQAYLAREGATPGAEAWHVLHEHFADVFATCAIGPAYACVCVMARFDPVAADGARHNHPPDTLRVAAILKTLDKVNGATQGGYGGLVQGLEATWRESVAAAKPRARPAAATQKALPADAVPSARELANTLYDQIAEAAPDVLYGGWPRAMALQDFFADPSRKLSELPEGTTIADVSNAACYARIDVEPGVVPGLARRAREMCDEIVARTSRQP